MERGISIGRGGLIFVASALLLWMMPVALLGYTETFYVCHGGDGTDPKSGNAATAWDSGNVSNSANWSSNVSTVDGKIGPGDRVYFMSDGGSITSSVGTEVITIQGSGAPGYPITLQGDGTVVIDGENARMAINAPRKADYVVISNLKATRGLSFTLGFWNCHYWVVEHCEIWGTYSTGTHDGSNVAGCGDYNLFQYNDIHDTSHNHCIYIFEGDDDNNSSSNVIQYNTIRNSAENGINFNGADVQFTGNVIRYNAFSENHWADIAIQTGDGTEIYGNTFVHTQTNCYNGIIVGGDGEGAANGVNVRIYNNDFYGNFAAMLLLGTTQRGNVVIFYNNICFSLDKNPSSNYYIAINTSDSTLSSSDHNCYFNMSQDAVNHFYVAGGSSSSLESLAQWQGATRLDAGSLYADPRMTNPAGGDFSLLADSPCIDKGTQVDMVEDRLGTPTPQGASFDIGAIESLPSGIRPPSPSQLRVLP